MEGAELLKMLVNLGSTGVVIYLVTIYNKKEADRDKLFTDRLDLIQQRNLADQKEGRDQIRDLFAQIHVIFDRVITICNELSHAVKDLRDATKSNEQTTKSLMVATEANSKAIDELRKEFSESKKAH